MSKNIQIGIEHIFSNIALNLACSEKWGDNSDITQHIISEQRHAFKLQANAVISLLIGTELIPIGTPSVEYKGVYMPQQFVDYFNNNPDVFPEWYK